MRTKQSMTSPSRRPTGLRTLATIGAGLCVLASAPMLEQPAHADNAFTLQLETSAAFWLDTPQSDRFTPGFYGAIRPGIALGRVVSLQLSYAMLYTPAAKGFTDDGSAHMLTVGARFRPFATMQSDDSHYGGGLWFDVNAGYASTGDLDRFAFDVGLGYGFQVSPSFAIAPVVRYGQIVQGNNIPLTDPNDAQYITAGLNFTFGEAYEDEEKEERLVEERADAIECGPQKVAEAVPCTPTGCSDRDKDGVCDDFDNCPDFAGPVGAHGCPLNPCNGKPLVVLVQFQNNSSALPAPADHAEYMDPMLDAVAAAIAQDPSCNVCIMGYASQEGASDRNMTLSRERATAVQHYITKRGIKAARLPTTGMGENCLLQPVESDILNRRVEFRRLNEGEKCPTDCDRR